MGILIFAIYIVYLGSILAFSIRATNKIFPYDIPHHYIWGLLLGSIGMIVITAILQSILIPPRFDEFDVLVYILYVAPVGSLLGALTGSVIYLFECKEVRSARHLSFFGSLPLVILCFWSIYNLTISPEQYLSNARDAVFWLFAYGFPLIWIPILWYWSFTNSKVSTQKT